MQAHHSCEFCQVNIVHLAITILTLFITFFGLFS